MTPKFSLSNYPSAGSTPITNRTSSSSTTFSEKPFNLLAQPRQIVSLSIEGAFPQVTLTSGRKTFWKVQSMTSLVGSSKVSLMKFHCSLRCWPHYCQALMTKWFRAQSWRSNQTAALTSAQRRRRTKIARYQVGIKVGPLVLHAVAATGSQLQEVSRIRLT